MDEPMSIEMDAKWEENVDTSIIAVSEEDSKFSSQTAHERKN